MVIAVTGDIGAGKSTASRLLAQKLSCKYINADVAAQAMWLRADVRAKAINRFGERILNSDGIMSIRKISDLVFSDESAHKFVNALLHPLVMHDLEELSREYDDVVFEIPLLSETGHHEWIDIVVYVAAEFDVRANRREKQRGWSVDELMRRERFLLPREKRIAMSDYVIHNDKDITELKEQINELGEKLHERKRK